MKNFIDSMAGEGMLGRNARNAIRAAAVGAVVDFKLVPSDFSRSDEFRVQMYLVPGVILTYKRADDGWQRIK